MTPLIDKEIVRLMKHEQTYDKAFKLLLTEYSERLYWHIRKMVINHDDADDVLQESFIKIFQGLHSFRGESALFTWLYKIATNETLTFLGKKKKQLSQFDSDYTNYMIESLCSEAGFSGDEIQKKLQLAILKLPERQRLVFNMKYLDNMKFKEIAPVLQVTVGALKASYFHAVNKIEDYLKNEDFY